MMKLKYTVGYGQRLFRFFALVFICVPFGCGTNVNDDAISVLSVQMVTKSSTGEEAEKGGYVYFHEYQNHWQGNPAEISADGMYVAFESTSENLGIFTNPFGWTEGTFRRGIQEQSTEYLCVDNSGVAQGRDSYSEPAYSKVSALSPDGQFVLFLSNANDIASPATGTGTFTDNNTKSDFYIRDCSQGKTVCVTVDKDHNSLQTFTSSSSTSYLWRERGAIASDGQNLYVLFQAYDQMVHEAGTGNIGVAGAAEGDSQFGTPFVISDSVSHLYLRKIPISSFLKYETHSTYLVSISTVDNANGDSININNRPDIAYNGNNVFSIVYTHKDGIGNMVANPSGIQSFTNVYYRTIDFASEYGSGNMLGDLHMVSKRDTGTTVDPGDNNSCELSNYNDGGSQVVVYDNPRLSSDGSTVVFSSRATNLDITPQDNNYSADVFVWKTDDPGGNEPIRISLALGGVESSNASNSGFPDVSSDGQYVVFESGTTDFVVRDFNGMSDIFVWDTVNSVMTRASITPWGSEADGDCIKPTISDDGSYVVYASRARNLLISPLQNPAVQPASQQGGQGGTNVGTQGEVFHFYSIKVK